MDEKKVLFLDIDGVICNWVDATIFYHSIYHAHDQILPIHSYDLTRSFEHADDMRSKWLTDSSEGGYYDLTMKNAYPYPGTPAVVKQLEEMFTIVYITSRPEQYYELTASWLSKWGFVDAAQPFTLLHSGDTPKGLFLSRTYETAGSFLVDDSPSQLKDYQKFSQRPTVCITRPWNGSWQGYRIDDLSELIALYNSPIFPKYT